MMTLRPDPHEAVQEPIRLPPLVASRASLSPMEKSLLGHFIILSRPKLIVEVGVYRAVTTCLIMEFLRLNEIDAQVVGFDMEETCAQLLRDNTEVRRWTEEGRLRLISGELPFSLRRWVEEERPVVDLALLDARHDFPAVDWELKLLWPCLSERGCILGHDYSAKFEGVRYAFDHFAAKHGAHLLPLESQWTEGEHGRDCALVALRRPTYRKTLRHWLTHRGQGWRADLVRGKWTGPLWKKVLRPLLRGGMKRALFTACNRAFFPGAEALLAGSARLHPEIPRFCMVPAEEIAEARGRLGQLAEIVPPPRALAGIPPEMQVSIYKLFAVTLPFETVAYVDADAIFCAPAPELWEIVPGQWNAIEDGARSLAATVPEVMAAAFARQFPEMGAKKAFNGGVFALRTAEWRHLPDDYERVLAAGGYPTYHPIFDQAMMNAMIQPRVNWLPFAFNVHNLFDREIPRDARVIHYAAGVCKPWDARYPRHEPQYHYWLKHGLHETRAWPLLKSRLLVAAITPKRLLGRMLRQRRERRGGAEVRSRWDAVAES